MRHCLLLVLLLLTLSPASKNGTIRGRVTDAFTGQPLKGANIIIESTEMGAATDGAGEYFVPFVRVGAYDITASFVGFSTVTVRAATVIAGQTLSLDFQLEPEPIPLEPVVVNAENVRVVRTQTQTRRTIKTSDIRDLPLHDINQIIELQAGVTQSEQGLHVRGGRSTEVTFYVDGIVTKSPHYGEQTVKVNRESVEEVDIITGGFDAEYGEAMSGVINVITREGGAKPSGLIQYTTDEVFTSARLNYGYNAYEVNVGGGLLDGADLRYMLSGALLLTDAHEAARYRVVSPRMDHTYEGKLSYRLGKERGRVALLGHYAREQFTHYKDIWGEQSFVFHLDHNTAELLKHHLAVLSLDYLLGKNTMLEAKLGYTRSTRFHAVRDLAEEARRGRQWYDDYVFKAGHFPALFGTISDDAVIKSYLVDSLCDTTLSYHYAEMDRYGPASLRRNPFGALGFFYTVGDNRLWRYLYNREYQGTVSITTTRRRVHEVKVGINVTAQNVGWYDNNLPFYRIPFWDMYDQDPLRVVAYAQDIMDLQGIVARVGLRVDYFDSKASGLVNPADQNDTTTYKVPPGIQVAPRLGFSMPVTQNSKFRFNYGHFYQVPTAHDLYRATKPSVVWLLLHRYNSVLGNPNLTVERTVAYEFGYENQVTSNTYFGFVVYFKDIYDLIQTRRILAIPYAYYRVFNVDYGNVKGVEFTLHNRFSDLMSVDVSYTLQYAKGTASYAWQHYYEIYQDDPDPESGEYNLPRTDYWLSFDQRHAVNGSVRIELPRDAASLLRDARLDLVFSYHSGSPYTPQDLKGRQLGDENSARMPGYVNVDAGVVKDLKIGAVKPFVFCNIYNLFNTEQITTVYSTTGRPDSDGASAFIKPDNFTLVSMASESYTPQADHDHDGLNRPEELCREYIAARDYYYNNPFNWKPGFCARVGLGIRF